MEAWIPVATLIGVATITPGPNNIALLAMGMQGKASRVVEGILGVISAGLVMLAVGVTGAAAVVEIAPQLRRAASLLGALYLLWLGSFMLWRTFGAKNAPTNPHATRMSASSGVPLFLFQFVNPKAWMLVLTVATLVPSGHSIPQGVAIVGILFAAISAMSLIGWAAVGFSGRRWYSAPRGRLVTDRVLAALLFVSAGMLIVGG